MNLMAGLHTIVLLAALVAQDPAQQPPRQASPAVTRQLEAYDVLARERLAVGLKSGTERQWVDMRMRERALLAAAIDASTTDDDLRATFYAAVGQHNEIALNVARRALKQRTAPQWWHYTGIAAAALAFSDSVKEPQKTELLNEARSAILAALPLKAASWVWLLSGQIHDALREWKAAKSAFSLAMNVGVQPQDRPAILRGQWRSASALNETADADK